MFKSRDQDDSAPLDLSGAKRNVWLVKVPKYLASKWLETPEGHPVGKIRVTKNHRGTELSYTMDKNLAKVGNALTNTFATDQKFVLRSVEKKNLAVFSTCNAKIGEKRAMEGRVVEKLDCRPVVGENYMKLKRTQMIEANKRGRCTKQLKLPVRNVYKPVNFVKEEHEYEMRKKLEGKKIRTSKQELERMLFAAFESHQFYNIKDLECLTQQPMGFLKEVLSDIGMYNKHPGHRRMWELKPEYRYHKSEAQSTDDIDSSQ